MHLIINKIRSIKKALRKNEKYIGMKSEFYADVFFISCLGNPKFMPIRFSHRHKNDNNPLRMSYSFFGLIRSISPRSGIFSYCYTSKGSKHSIKKQSENKIFSAECLLKSEFLRGEVIPSDRE